MIQMKDEIIDFVNCKKAMPRRKRNNNDNEDNE